MHRTKPLRKLELDYDMKSATPLGQGAFGHVVMAKNRRENKFDAIKFLTTPNYDVHSC